MADAWDLNLEDALDIVEALDEIAEERDYPPVVRDELKLIYQSLTYAQERVKLEAS